MHIALVLGLSVGVQLVAAGLAMRLMTTRQNRFASLLIVLALMLMAARRVMTLTHAIISPGPDDGEFAPEVIALFASLLLAFGLARLEPKRIETTLGSDTVDTQRRDCTPLPLPPETGLPPGAITELMPLGYACHKIVMDAGGQPIDYVFLDVNQAFGEQTGLLRAAIIGQPVTKVLPTITRHGRNWIGDYGQVALSGEVMEFEDYSAPLQRWYRVIAYAPQRGYFVTLVQDITPQKMREVAARRQESAHTRAEATHERYLSGPVQSHQPK